MHLRRVFALCALVLVGYFGIAYFFLGRSDEMDGESFMASRRTILRPPDTFNPETDCVTPFGTLLGVANRTPVYSNCANSFKSTHAAYFSFVDPMDTSEPRDTTRRDKIQTAPRWSTMDFVMRWCAFNKGVMPLLLESVPNHWERNYFHNPAKPTQVWDGEFIINYNEAASPDAIAYTRPRVGDLILYNGDHTIGFPNGHIAVVVAIENDIAGAGGVERYKELAKRGTVPRVLYPAEQNFDNKPWRHEGYSRVAYFRWREPSQPGMAPEGYIEDDSGLSVLGRMRVGKAREPRPETDQYEEGLQDDYHDDDDL